jgi:preprotein translocase subunit YajC
VKEFTVHTMLSNLGLFGQYGLAQAASGGGSGGGAGGPMGCGGAGGMQSLIFMLLMFAVFWFILIRPQQKKAKEHQAFLTALAKGDSVVTRGGVVGRVTGVQDNIVTLEVQEKVRIRVLKSYIEGRHSDTAAAAQSAARPAATTTSESKN